jgi:hypothetical protein
MQDDVWRLCPETAPVGVQYMHKMIFEFLKKQNWSMNMFSDVNRAIQGLPLEEINSVDYRPVGFERPELQRMLWDWHKQLTRGLLLPVLLRSERAASKEVALEMVDEYIALVDEGGRAGIIYPMPVVTVVWRKAT